MGQETENVKLCEKCGNVVIVHRALDGAVHYIPVSDAFIKAALVNVDIDTFLHDRLRRAENIIVDLRAQLKAKTNPA